MIKKIVVSICVLAISFFSFAQDHSPNRMNTYSDEGPTYGFTKENIFVGGSVALGYNGWDFNAGISPEVGWTLAKWFDAGALINLNYSSERADPTGYYNSDIRYRSFNYGIGAFARIYPVNFLFFQIEPENNWISTNYLFPDGTSRTFATSAPSLLLGVGYSQRLIGRTNFYIALLFDAGQNRNSPYVDPNSGAALPVVKAGFDIYLHPRYER